MRKLTISSSNGDPLGTISESEDGTLQGEGKGESLIEQAPGKSFEDWIENGHHSKYLKYAEVDQT